MITSRSTEYDITVTSGGSTGSSGSGGSSSGSSDEEEVVSEDTENKVVAKGISRTFEVPDVVVEGVSKLFVNLTKSSLSEAKGVVFDRVFNVTGTKTIVSSFINYTGENVSSLLVYEKIPKAIANSTKEINFGNLNYIIIKEDPEVVFVFNNISKYDAVNYSYIVDKNTTNYEQFDYSDPLILVTNNGLSELTNNNLSLRSSLLIGVISLSVIILLFTLVVVFFALRKIKRKGFGSKSQV